MDTRLIIDEPARGSWNMAVDEALLQWAGQGGGTALRFYQWQEPTLSLGYFQQVESRREHPPSLRLPIVRRTTGGGAIVHDRELTYSFVMPIRNRFSSAVQDVVMLFHTTLIETMANCGIDAMLCGDAASESAAEPFLCFQRRSSLDILVAGSKVVGSAQRRHQGALLQHGSILLARSPSAEALPGLTDLTGVGVGFEWLVEDWSQRLAKRCDLSLTSSALTEPELSRVVEIERNRFDHEHWTRKR